MKVMILRLAGPTQFYADTVKLRNCQTCRMPTKSAIVGLLSSAFGYQRNDQNITKLSDNIQLAVRSDKAGKIEDDFKTIDVFDTEETGCAKLGKKVLRHEKFISDGIFTAFISFKDVDLYNQCKKALEHPVYPLFLGKKCCPPATPIFCEISEDYDSLDEAVNKYELAQRHDNIEKIVYETDEDICENDVVYEKNDDIYDLARKEYFSRRVALRHLKRR